MVFASKDKHSCQNHGKRHNHKASDLCDRHCVNADVFKKSSAKEIPEEIEECKDARVSLVFAPHHKCNCCADCIPTHLIEEGCSKPTGGV